MKPFEPPLFDAVVIGGGVVGCAVLRELSRHEGRFALLEKESDLAEGASKGNSGVIHAGFNVPPGSLKARMNAEGLRRIYGLAASLGVPNRRTGKLVVAADEAGRARLEKLLAQGRANGAPELEIVDGAAIGRLAPGVAGRWALHSPWTGLVSPYELALALAEDAWRNGAAVRLEAPVAAVDRRPDGFLLTTPRGPVLARWVINAAGIFADEVAALAGIDGPRVYPFRGEYLIADKEAGAIVPLPVYPVPPPDDSYLGVHITPTLDGNVLLGPSSEFVPGRTDAASTREVLERLKSEAFGLVPGLRRFPFIHAYAGLRPKLTPPEGGGKLADFIIEESGRAPRWINLLGIESPGLTAAPAIAARVAEIMGAAAPLRPKRETAPSPPPRRRFAAMDDAEREAAVRSDGEWGEIVCRCEHVTRAEVRAALANPFGVRTLDGIKRRTRCGMGRCQGGFCTPRLTALLQEEGVPLEGVSKRGGGSHLYLGKVKA